jgi:hypothetical protein
MRKNQPNHIPGIYRTRADMVQSKVCFALPSSFDIAHDRCRNEKSRYVASEVKSLPGLLATMTPLIPTGSGVRAPRLRRKW